MNPSFWKIVGATVVGGMLTGVLLIALELAIGCKQLPSDIQVRRA